MRPATDLPLKKACPLEGDLPGSGAIRHCASCATDVVDLSLLTAAEADRMLADPARPKCVSYRVDHDGNVIHLASPPVPARRRLPLLAAGLLLAACGGSAVDGSAPASTSTATIAAAASSSAAPPAVPPEPTEKHTRGELAAVPPAPAASGANANDGAGCNPDGDATAANDKQGNPLQPNVPGPKKPKQPKHPMMRGYM